MNFERIWHQSYSPGVPPETAIEQTSKAEALSLSALSYPEERDLRAQAHAGVI